MKHGSFKAIHVAACLVWVFVVVFPSFGDEVTPQFETLILEYFNGDSDYEWKVDASRFATKTDDESYPQIAFVNTWPIAVYGYNRDGSQELKSLGVHGRFDRRGYNWIDIYPSKGGDGDDQDDPIEIPIPGRMRTIDMWVWGANYDFYIEVYLRDTGGVVHNLRLGSIAHNGWKNLRTNVPTSISQAKRTLPRRPGLSFIKFRIWTQPTEPVGDFYVYFKQLKVLTDIFESLFDGNELADPEYVQELWADAGNADER